MKQRANVIARLFTRRARVLAELHPTLRAKVEAVILICGQRVCPWEGYRSAADQVDAVRRGASQAAPGHSPHNFKPALGCDLVLNPAMVPVRAHKDDQETPDLWDDETPLALAAWAELETAAKDVGLVRIDIVGKDGVSRRDQPHVELPQWRSYLPG